MIDFTSAPGNLYNILGTLAGLIGDAANLQNTLDTAFAGTNGVIAQMENMPDIQSLAGGQYLALTNSPSGAIAGFSVQTTPLVINRIVFNDNQRFGQNLSAVNLPASISYIIQQMTAQGQTIRKQNVTSTNTNFTGVGNAVVISSVYRLFDGRLLENLFAETITLTCTADSYSSQTQANQETVSVQGQGAQPNIFAFDWPLGSNGSGTLTVINPNGDAAQGNRLTNSSFEDFTDNVPDNFELTVGTAGVNVFEETGIVYEPTSGGKSIRFLGDGSTLIELRQPFDDTDGTTYALQVQSQYSICCFLRRDGVAPAAGVLQVDLFNITTGQVVVDVANTPCSFTVDLTSLTTQFLSFTGCFRTPAILSGDVCFRFHLTTALTTGRSVYLDTFSMGGPMGQLYVGGPFISVHAGSIPLFASDQGFITTTNPRGSGGSLDTWQTALWRMVPLVAANEILFPSSDSPTISDSLIVVS